jgi:hypothetical protein
LLPSSSVVRVTKSRMKWAEHVTNLYEKKKCTQSFGRKTLIKADNLEYVRKEGKVKFAL